MIEYSDEQLDIILDAEVVEEFGTQVVNLDTLLDALIELLTLEQINQIRDAKIIKEL